MPNKATLAGAIMAVAVLLADWLGIPELKQINEEWLLTVIAIAGAIGVWVSSS